MAHAGNTTDSDEEAQAIAAIVSDLVTGGTQWIDRHGVAHPVTVDDIVIVAPYNAHVGAIERACAAVGLPRVFAGTVDKFQGQEAPISIYALGTSAPEDAPRGMEFLYSLNRLNVATSRARCVATIVMSPALVRVACHTPRQMRLANGLCLAVEAARDDDGQGHRRVRPAAEAPPLVLFPAPGRRGRAGLTTGRSARRPAPGSPTRRRSGRRPRPRRAGRIRRPQCATRTSPGPNTTHGVSPTPMNRRMSQPYGTPMARGSRPVAATEAAARLATSGCPAGTDDDANRAPVISTVAGWSRRKSSAAQAASMHARSSASASAGDCPRRTP